MNLLTCIMVLLGLARMLLAIFGQYTETMDALEIHSYMSEGLLWVIFAIVLHQELRRS